ncbi:MAG: hypothetical protein ACYDCO_06980 [Armatimonadota bacterium]
MRIPRAVSLLLPCLLACAGLTADVQKAPFNYIGGTGYHVLPETHTDESGYASLCEGLNGKIYVGTAAYGRNAYLVEFDPATGLQRIVIDTNKLCGLTATGYAAQAKIHTQNFVGPSGTIYVGSKQGYRRGPEDTADYPGGYVMTYDPKTGKAENLGMPYPTEGVIDTVADEARGLIYVVTCENQHWMVYSMKDKTYRELGPMLAPYATTLVDAKGRAHVITKDFKLATYDPAADKVQVRPLYLGKEPWQPRTRLPIPNWSLAKDRRTAYLSFLDDPILLRLDLLDDGKDVKMADLGRWTEGKGPDLRSGLAIAPDGRIYTLISVKNETGFGAMSLHHLLRYDPKTRTFEDLGVPALKNPEFFAWKGADGKPLPWSHGYQTLPDGTQSPLYNQALVVTADNTIYATFLYPFTLFRIDAFRTARKW